MSGSAAGGNIGKQVRTLHRWRLLAPAFVLPPLRRCYHTSDPFPGKLCQKVAIVEAVPSKRDPIVGQGFI